MNQIKYLVQACLMLFAGIIFFSAFDLVKDTQIISDKQDAISDTSPIQQQISGSNYNGKNLFQQNCASCHALHKRILGPALYGFTEKEPWKEKENIYRWVKNPALFAKESVYAKSLVNEYQIMMQAFPNLSEKEIDDIVSYINDMSLGY